MIQTLTRINDKPAERFWRDDDAAQKETVRRTVRDGWWAPSLAGPARSVADASGELVKVLEALACPCIPNDGTR